MITRRPWGWAMAGVLLGAAAGAQGIRFENVTATAGLEPYLRNWRLAHSASWGDVTGNGYPDLIMGAFANLPRWTDGPLPNMLFFNRDGRRFELSPQKELPMEGLHARVTHLLLADLDGDGDLDLMVVCHAGSSKEYPSTLWENLGDGRFREVTPTTGDWPRPMAYRNVAAADLDRDGRLDLVGCDNHYRNWTTGEGTLIVLLNRGSFTFEEGRSRLGFPERGTTGLGLAIGDVNDDGRLDIFVADSNRLFVSGPDGRYRECSAGVFLKPTSGDREAHTCGAFFGDLNGNGRLDLVTTEHGEGAQIRLYLNRETDANGRPVFVDATEAAGLMGALPARTEAGLALKQGHLSLADFDNDGRLDIWLGLVFRDDRGEPQPVVLRNLGNDAEGRPRFTPIPRDRLLGYYAVAPVADFDRDGRMDGFLPAWFRWEEGPSYLFRNVTEATGHWLGVRVRGSGKGWNTMGIGATVRIYEAGRGGDRAGFLGRRDITVGNGYSSGEEANAFFGVGGRTAVDVEIQWNGVRHRVARQAVDRWLVVAWPPEAEPIPE